MRRQKRSQKSSYWNCTNVDRCFWMRLYGRLETFPNNGAMFYAFRCTVFPYLFLRALRHQANCCMQAGRPVYDMLIRDDYGNGYLLSLIHISEPTRRTPISYA